jgi:hypothetical protein
MGHGGRHLNLARDARSLMGGEGGSIPPDGICVLAFHFACIHIQISFALLKVGFFPDCRGVVLVSRTEMGDRNR